MLHPGQMLGDRYRIERELGHGGYGRVYLADELPRVGVSSMDSPAPDREVLSERRHEALLGASI